MAASRADAAVDAEVLARTATELFRLKQFERSAQLFMQAYAKSHKPALVFNAARAYQEAGKFGDAAGLFRLYLTISSDAAGIADATARLQECEAKGVASPTPPEAAAAPAPHVEAPPPVRAPDPPAPAVPIPAVAAPQAQTPVAAEQGPSHLWAWVATGAAAAAAVGGAGLMASGSSDANTANSQRFVGSGGPALYGSQFDAAQQKWNAGAGLATVAVVCAGVATWQWLRHPAQDKAAADTAAMANALAWAKGQPR